MAFLFSTIGAANTQSSSNGHELEDLPRHSTVEELERRNGFAQSYHRDLGERIFEDIRNGNYECSICLEAITAPLNDDDSRLPCQLWACSSCHHAFHFTCMRTWSETRHYSRPSLLTIFNPVVWKCASCSTEHDAAESARCWCHRESFFISEAEKPNSCGGICRKRSTCRHGIDRACQKNCHPGPCKILCPSHCRSSPGNKLEKTPGRWKRFCDRVKQVPSHTFSRIFWTFCLFALTYTAMMVWIVYHIRWAIMPWKYPEFASKKTFYSTGEIFGVIFIALPFWLLGIGIPLVGLVDLLGGFFTRVFNLNSENLGLGKSYVKLFGGLFLFLTGLGIFLLPLVAFAGGPSHFWYEQMKNSCAGLDSRVRITATSVFDIRSVAAHIPSHRFYLAQNFYPQMHSNATYQDFYRFSGSTEWTPQIAVDIDTHNKHWRLVHLDVPDMANQWLAYNSTQRENLHLKSLPEFSAVNENVVLNGTFTRVNREHPHMEILGMGMHIQNMHQILYGCEEQEPFLRIFNTYGLNQSGIDDILRRDWTPKRDDRIVMRAAGFGHGRPETGEIDICIRDGDRTREEKKGISDMDLVPLAIIQALRKEARRLGIHEQYC